MSKIDGQGQETFVDRTEPLAVLQSRFDEVVDAGSGRAVFISGEPGIGKTTLVERFLAGFQADSATVLRTRRRELAPAPSSIS